MTSSAPGPDVAVDDAVAGQGAADGHAAGGALAVPGSHPAPSTAGHPDPRLSGEKPLSEPGPVTILLYSDDADTRARVRRAIGRRISSDLPPVEWTEVATEPVVIREVDRGGYDLLVLDGEAAPAGGLGLCKQLKDEIYECPPVLVLTGRPQDAWLATWSRADAAVPHPLDPRALAEAVAVLARRRRG